MVSIRRLVVLGCVALGGVAIVVPALGATLGSRPSAAPFSASDPDYAAGSLRDELRRDRLRSADAKSHRKRSRTRYRNTGRAEALEAGRRAFPDEFTSRPRGGLEPAPGLRLVKTLGDGAGLVQDVAGNKLLLASSLPLETKTAAGDEEPVDLALTQSADAFRSINPVAAVRIAKRSRDGVTFGDKAFTITPASDTDVTGGETSDRVLFANALPDADVLISPRPAGAEIAWLLRSADSPERQFRKIIGYKHLAALALAVERDVAAGRAATNRSITPPTTTTTTTEPAATLAAAH